MVFTKRLTAIQPDLLKKRGDRFLLVWKDIPHWMVVDEEVVSVIQEMKEPVEPKEIAMALRGSYNGPPDRLLGEILELQAELKRTGIAYSKKPKRISVSEKPVLENITINVTRRCNLRCTHCYIEDLSPLNEHLSITDLERFVKAGKGYFGKNLNYAILGGEPLLMKELVLDIARMGQQQGKEVIVSTNGLLIDPEFASRARDTNLVVQVSLEGSNPKNNDWIRGSGSFEKAKNGINILVENGVYSIISMVVQRSNLGNMESFYRFGRSLGVNEIRYIPLKIMGRARSKKLVPVPYIELLQAIRNLIKKHPDSVDLLGRDYFTILKNTCSLSSKRLYCGTGLRTLLVDADGEVYPCPNHTLAEFRCGNLRKMGFRDIWLKSPVLKKIRSVYDVNRINDQCPHCEVKYWCMGGCRGEVYENTKDLRSRPARCQEVRNAILEMFWIISEEGELVKNAERTEYF